ncbi:MAG: hypothetical protein NVSMB24_29020 [Mucilaginibacter sp.]
MKTPALFFILASMFIRSAEGTASGLSYPINLNGSHGLTISGKVINGGNVPAITLTNCHNIHITKNRLGNSREVGIYLYNCYNITIDYNKIANVSTGVYVVNTSRGGISVIHNQFRNMHGPMPRGQFVQFNNVNGPYNSISYNRGENVPGYSNAEDAINLFKSTGTPDSPIKVVGNRIRGGGPSKSGGGIMLGDNGGRYQVASHNILVDPGQYGIAVAGGDHITLTGNIIYGRAQYFTNVGIYVWGQGGYHCSDITVRGNRVRFMSAKNVENDSWIGTGEAKPAGWDSNEWGAQIGPAILPRAVVSF